MDASPQYQLAYLERLVENTLPEGLRERVEIERRLPRARRLMEEDRPGGEAARIHALSEIYRLWQLGANRPDAERGMAYSQSQAEKGSKRAAQRWSGDAREEYDAATQRLAGMCDAWGDLLPPSDLWPHLFAELDSAGLNPTEPTEGTYEVSGLTNPITFEGFRKQIQRARKLT